MIEEHQTATHDTTPPEERPLKPALLRGAKLLCPNCGTGPLMSGFLSVHDQCEVCGEELFHHRADDGPAYVTILISGHILAPLMLILFEIYRPDPLLLVVGFSIGFVAMALFMLPRIKGMFVALQWAKRMHGFGAS
jgi:uncharacterized protein (DUF983 family)